MLQKACRIQDPINGFPRLKLYLTGWKNAREKMVNQMQLNLNGKAALNRAEITYDKQFEQISVGIPELFIYK